MNVARDVVYARPRGVPLALDVGWPAGGVARPLVVLLHGGGWSGGSRASLDDELRALVRRGYAAATVDYRLAHAPHDVFPAALDDVRAAVAFLRAGAHRFGADPTRVALSGVSAGGHLASLLAVSDAGGAGAVQAVIAYAAPHDLRAGGAHTPEQARLVTNFLGAHPADDPACAERASPIAIVRAGAPPCLLVHGAADDLVPPAQSRRMAAALAAVGTPATLIELPGVGHALAAMGGAAQRRVHAARDALLDRWLAPPAEPNEPAA